MADVQYAAWSYRCCFVYRQHTDVFGRFAEAGRFEYVKKRKRRTSRRFPDHGLPGAGGTKTDIGGLKAVDEYIVNEVPKEIGFPHETYVNTRSIRSTEVYPVDPTKVDASRTRTMTLSSMSGLQDHIELSGGKMFSEKASGDTIEALMLEEAMYRQDLHVGDVMEYPVSGGSGITLKVKIVGAFQPKNESDPYWYQGFEGMMNSFYLLTKCLMKICFSACRYRFTIRAGIMPLIFGRLKRASYRRWQVRWIV